MNVSKKNNYKKGSDGMHNRNSKKAWLGLSVLAISLFSNTLNVVATTENKDGSQLMSVDKNQFVNKIAADSVTIGTNADQEFGQGDLYSLTINLTNNDGDIIPQGTKIYLNIPKEAVDYTNIDLTNDVLNENFDVAVDAESGQIILTLKKDIVGDSKVIARINIGVIGESAKSYDVSASVTSNGNEQPVVIDYPTITIKDTSTNPPGTYGYLNQYWGNSESDKGGFTGRTEGEDSSKYGVFNRNTNRLSTFAQLNRLGTLLLDTPTTWKFQFDANQRLLPETIKLIDGNTRQPISQNFYEVIITSPTSFSIKVSDEYPQNTFGSLESTYQTEVYDDSLTYVNSTSNEHKDIYGHLVTDEFSLNSRFALLGDSDFFPTLTVEDKSFTVGYLTDENRLKELLANIKAKDTNDGDISAIVGVDDSNLDPNTVGDYEVTYYVKNSLGNISRRTAIIHITEKIIGGDITVEYVDTAGNSLAPNKVLHGNIGENYETTAIEIEGYKLKTVPTNKNGKFTDENQVVTYVYEGQLIFVSAPDVLNFGSNLPIPKVDTEYNLESKEGDLTVTDYRGENHGWSMTGKLISEMTSTSGHQLEDSLYYQKDGEKQLFSKGSSISIFNAKTKDSIPVTISDSWSKTGDGPKLKVKAGEPRSESYQGKIQWALQNVPVND
ncbi:MucBP domain-containing protein [Carnobacterium divergens]|uniref:MucBP domain-containing protein n=1 Tax=Carnobacterium divergens TaxID=2748 RepID=A0AAW8R9Q8_CARDV|nr:MucBP domain-containing protein [Carnobacterium divergens]MDT1957046.1 MucBP domain-containing protein [Carnobacterium divergens]MDT1973016.1 MucBP domain-containing protein [Carnobacterium divergens]